MLNLFTYGTLMDADIWDELVASPYETAKFSLSGYKRYALKDKAYPGLIREEGATTHGLIYFNVSNFDIVKLDVFEGQEYERITIDTVFNDQAITLETFLFVGESEFLIDEDWDLDHFVDNDTQNFKDDFLGWK